MRNCISLLAVFLFSVVGFADTLHVPGDYSTIQAGIDAAVNGDTVLVAPGTYLENIDYLGKAITVRSSGGSAVTMIDGSTPSNPNNASVVTFRDTASPAVLDGFLLTKGIGTVYGPDDQYHGGGIFCLRSSPTVINNSIRNNQCAHRAGAIYCEESSIKIIDNYIRNNRVPYGECGAVYIKNLFEGDLQVEISGNTFYLNKATKDAGAIYHQGYLDGHIFITGNSFVENLSGLGRGGAIYIEYGYATIKDNYLSGNTAEASGGAIYGGAVIEDNVLVDNFSNYQGGAIYKGGHVHGNVIMNNTASSSGGGVYGWGDTLTHNVFIGNESQSGSGGGAYFRTHNNDFHIENNIIQGNSAEYLGGGLYVATSGFRLVFIRNNVITNNSSIVHGGGIYCVDQGGYDDILITNNTICDNTAAISAGGIYLCNYNNNVATIKNCILWNNSALENKEAYENNDALVLTYCDVDDELLAVEPGCFRDDPLFVSPVEGDYHITFGSPCRDTGDPSTLLSFEDFEGDSRGAWGGTVDIGADEFYRHLYCTGDFTPDGAIKAKFVGMPDTTPVGLFFGSGELDPPLSTMWGEFYLEAPWFLIPIGVVIPSNGVLEIPATLPSSPSAPYDLFMQALIGLSPESLSNLFVLEIR